MLISPTADAVCARQSAVFTSTDSDTAINTVALQSLQVEVAKDLVAKGFRCSDDRVFADQVDKCIQMYETQVSTYAIIACPA
jgi:hypothetical protein